MKKNRDEILEVVENVYSSLTSAQKTVAKFFASNKDDFVFSTAGDLAVKIGVSESTIVRFAKILEFENYTDMQKYMQREYMRTTSAFDRIQMSSEHDDDVLDKAVMTDISFMMKLLNPEFRNDFKKAADMLTEAPLVLVGGSRGSAPLASTLFYNLQYMKPNVISLAADSGNWQDCFFDTKPNDLLVAITMPRYSKRTCDMIRLAKKMSLAVLSITDSKISPAAELADCVLACEISPSSFIWSSTVVASVINALLTQVAHSKNPAILERVKNRVEMIKHYTPFEE